MASQSDGRKMLVSRHTVKKRLSPAYNYTIVFNMWKITIFISSISWQVSKQNSKSVSYIYSVHDMSCELVTVNYRKITRTSAEVQQ